MSLPDCGEVSRRVVRAKKQWYCIATHCIYMHHIIFSGDTYWRIFGSSDGRTPNVVRMHTECSHHIANVKD